MSEAAPQPIVTLENVQLAFEHWRSTRASRGPTPVSLQRRAAALLSDHSPTHICAALKINNTALKSWTAAPKKMASSPASTPTQTDSKFVELPTEPCSDNTLSDVSERDTSITIDLSEGLRLSINGRFTLGEIIRAACQQHQVGRS